MPSSAVLPHLWETISAPQNYHLKSSFFFYPWPWRKKQNTVCHRRQACARTPRQAHNVLWNLIFAGVEALNAGGKHWAQRLLRSLCCSPRGKAASPRHASEKQIKCRSTTHIPAFSGIPKAVRCWFCYCQPCFVQDSRHIHNTAKSNGRIAGKCVKFSLTNIYTFALQPEWSEKCGLCVLNNHKAFPWLSLQDLHSDTGTSNSTKICLNSGEA